MRFRATVFYSAGFGNELAIDGAGALHTRAGRSFELSKLRRDPAAVIQTNQPEAVCKSLDIPFPDAQVMAR